MARTVLALMAHPDDAEILCGGLLTLLWRRGWRVEIATATCGDCGTSSLPPEAIASMRREEARRAAARLGGEHHTLGLLDLRVVYGSETLTLACDLLRRVRPDVVVTHSPADYMLDHEETSRIARAACFAAPIPNAPRREPIDPLERIPWLYYADPVEGNDNLGNRVEPHFLVDVTSVLDEKVELLACHASQREWLRAHHGIDEYIEGMKRWGKARGEPIAVAHAEGFRQHLGHAYPLDDVLAEVVGDLCHPVAPPPGRRP